MLSLLFFKYKKYQAYSKFFSKIRDGVYSTMQFKWLCSDKRRYNNLNIDGQIDFLHTFFTLKDDAIMYENYCNKYYKQKIIDNSDICVENEALFPSIISTSKYYPKGEFNTMVKIPFINAKALALVLSSSDK